MRAPRNVRSANSRFITVRSSDRSPGAAGSAGQSELEEPTAEPDDEVRVREAVDTVRAIAAGEVDGFVVADGGPAHRVLTLSTADRPYRMFVENMREGAATVSADGLILYSNRRLGELVSHSRESLVGTPLAELVAAGHEIGADRLRGTGSGATFEVDLVASSGVAVPVLVGATPLDVEGELLTCLTFTDLSSQKAQDRVIARLSHDQGTRLIHLQDAQAALTQQATHDPLTNLANRALLFDRIEQSLSQAQRSGRCTAVIFVDLDFFKDINDAQGHAAGDEALRWVAARLTAMMRPMDTVARVGGDEFVILAPEIDNHLDAIDIADRIVNELRHHGAPGTGEPRTASVGVTVSVSGRGSAEVLLHEADTAMYQAKAGGRNRVAAFEAELGQQAKARSGVRHSLSSALTDRRVFLAYQPIIDIAGGRLTGFEALARIAERDGTIVPPAEFIPVAESSGLITQVGTEVLRLACQQAGVWQPAGGTSKPPSVAVNLSGRQFAPGDLIAQVCTELDRNRLDPGRLHIELTETAIIDLRPDVIEQLRQLRELGVEIGLDDFGTGYSSLTHLRQLPLTFVKIDQSFVHGLALNRTDELIVAAIIDLARKLGLRSIAEGVETEEQLSCLRQLECEQAQGYLFARPLPPHDLRAAVTRDDWFASPTMNSVGISSGDSEVNPC